MKTSIIEKFIEQLTQNKHEHLDRFYEIFSARGFLLELDRNHEKVRLSNRSHREDGEFLEALQNIHYKKTYHKPHQDAIDTHETENIMQGRHAYFHHIDTQAFDIDNKPYLTEVFTHEIPIDLFRLNWGRDHYGKFDQFKTCIDLPMIRVYDLEPFIARLVKAISSIGISTWSSCEGHWGEPAYIVFDRRYHRIWFQAIFHAFIRKKLNLVCRWEWLGWDERCSVTSPGRDPLRLYLEIQKVARLIHEHKDFLRTIKKQVCSLLTDTHKNMSQKDLLNTFECYFEESITKA